MLRYHFERNVIEYFYQESVNEIEDELNSSDVDTIANGIVSKLNDVVNILAPAKPIQIKNKSKFTKDPEARVLYNEAKEAKNRAVENKDPEMYRIARNKSALASKKNFISEVKQINKTRGHNG